MNKYPQRTWPAWAGGGVGGFKSQPQNSQIITIKKKFWPPCSIWDLSSLIRDWTLTPCIGAQSLNYWTVREVPITFFLEKNTIQSKSQDQDIFTLEKSSGIITNRIKTRKLIHTNLIIVSFINKILIMIIAHFKKEPSLCKYLTFSLTSRSTESWGCVRRLTVSQLNPEGNWDTEWNDWPKYAQLTGRNQQKPRVPRWYTLGAPTFVPIG